ncbi:MAG: heparinase II/III family protein [Planctomycetota bacterium]|nr:heparinase II/III family protein [Planctomycetota bacterium]
MIQHSKIITAGPGVAVIITDFVTTANQSPSVRTVARVKWDEAGIEIRFDCWTDQITASERPRNDPDMWLDDSVEIYLDVGHTHDPMSHWMQFLVNATGCIYEKDNRNRDFSAPDLRASARKTDTGWSAEVAVTWKDIGTEPKPGDVWGFNLNRSEYPAGEHSCYAPTGGRHSDIHSWGHLIFTDDNGDYGQAMERLEANHQQLVDEEEAERRKKELDTRPFPDSKISKKQYSVFMRPEIIAAAKRNAEDLPWVADAVRRILEHAEYWKLMDDEEVWALVFGTTITRSWVVWTHGHCPSCSAKVVMYNWKADARVHPWKMQCPACDELFPKNDFAAFYRSGIDPQGIFDPELADRSLLFNTEHPEPDHPLHTFGVDDGEGYVDGDKRWRFIGHYLVCGHWRQIVMAGISSLSLAYSVTGEPVYAHKVGILIDRTADLYPTFDYSTQALVYESGGSDGYVTMWHDACEETKEMGLAYDRVFDAMKTDEELVRFLAVKAKQCGLENPKSSFADIQRNIEERIIRDALESYPKIHSNYPRAQVTQAFLKAVLNWPEERESILEHISRFVDHSTRFDGITGEKGLPTYSVYVIIQMANCLAEFSRIDVGFLSQLFKARPALMQTWRFYLDTLCLGNYYPQIGDATWFANRHAGYVGASFRPMANSESNSGKDGVFNPSSYLQPSMFRFFRDLSRQTADPDYVRLLYRANNSSLDGLPHDLWADNPDGFQKEVGEVIQSEGAQSRLISVNKEDWCLAILRSGEGERSRAAWLDYDAGGSHGHMDGMNLGLFAFGLDLMPDFGYPPLQYEAKKAQWYQSTAAHNTVVIDGENQKGHHLSHRWTGFRKGQTTLWHEGEGFRAIRVSGADLVDCLQFERTICMVDISPDDFYLLDIFRVVGGREHAKFMHSHFGELTTSGLNLAPVEEFGRDTQMRNFRGDPSAAPGWSADWKIYDRYELLPKPSNIHLRYTDLTIGAEACTCEGWVVAGIYNSLDEAWIPRLMIRRRKDEGLLATTFVSIIEPYENQSNLASIRRLPLLSSNGQSLGDEHVAVEIGLADGRRDVLFAADTENPLNRKPEWQEEKELEQPDLGLSFKGELGWTRWSGDSVLAEEQIPGGN